MAHLSIFEKSRVWTTMNGNPRVRSWATSTTEPVTKQDGWLVEMTLDMKFLLGGSTGTQLNLNQDCSKEQDQLNSLETRESCSAEF